MDWLETLDQLGSQNTRQHLNEIVYSRQDLSELMYDAPPVLAEAVYDAVERLQELGPFDNTYKKTQLTEGAELENVFYGEWHGLAPEVRCILSEFDPHTLRLWDEWCKPRSPSPSGTPVRPYLASCDPRTIRIWELVTGELRDRPHVCPSRWHASDFNSERINTFLYADVDELRRESRKRHAAAGASLSTISLPLPPPPPLSTSHPKRRTFLAGDPGDKKTYTVGPYEHAYVIASYLLGCEPALRYAGEILDNNGEFLAFRDLKMYCEQLARNGHASVGQYVLVQMPILNQGDETHTWPVTSAILPFKITTCHSLACATNAMKSWIKPPPETRK